MPSSSRAISSSDFAAAVDCSTSAAFCWVISSIWLTAWLTCTMPSDCSFEAAAISLIMVATFVTALKISERLSPVRFTSSAP